MNKDCSYVKSFINNLSNEDELQKDIGLEDEIKTLEFQSVDMMLFIDRYLEFNNAGRVEYVPEAVFVRCTKMVEWVSSMKLGITVYKLNHQVIGMTRKTSFIPLVVNAVTKSILEKPNNSLTLANTNTDTQSNASRAQMVKHNI